LCPPWGRRTERVPPPGGRVEEWARGRPDAIPIAIHVCQHSSPWQLEGFLKQLNESRQRFKMFWTVLNATLKT
jgi:hypothetical protein